MHRLLVGVDAATASASATGGPAAASAIMTTDTVQKTCAVQGSGYQIGGGAQGAAVLTPAPATHPAGAPADPARAPPDPDKAPRRPARATSGPTGSPRVPDAERTPP